MTANVGEDLIGRLAIHLRTHRSEAHQVLHHFCSLGRQFLLRSD